MYCSPIDLVAYGNHSRLIAQLASTDYGVIPTADEVLQYFLRGISTPDNVQALRLLSSRVEQAIDNATGDVNGYTALFPTITLPAETLKAACMDLALFRLHENLPEDSVIRINAENRITYFDKIATGKISINTDDASTAVVTGSAETVGSAVVFDDSTLAGY